MDPFTDSPAHHLRSTYLRMHRVTNRTFRPFGMTADQYVVLRLLCEGDGISQQELVSQCASDATTIGRMLDLMEGKKLIRRERASHDRRTRLVYITRTGKTMTKKLYRAAEPVRDALSATMSFEELNGLLAGLARLDDALKEMDRSSGKIEVVSSCQDSS